MLSVITLCAVILSVIMLSVVMLITVILSVAMMSVIMLIVVILSVVMLNVVAWKIQLDFKFWNPARKTKRYYQETSRVK